MNKIAELEASLTGMDGCIFCSECGARIDKNSKFCMKCGTAVDVNKVKLGAAVAEAMRGAESDTTGAEFAGQTAAADTMADYVTNRYV